jgi:hypothetical protein
MLTEAAKELTRLERWGSIGNIVAGGGAAVAAVASWWSIRSANKNREDELDRARPRFQFCRLSISKSSNGIATLCTLHLMVINMKQNPIEEIEYSITIFQKGQIDIPRNIRTELHSGSTERAITLATEAQFDPHTNATIILALRARDSNLLSGEAIFTISYFINAGGYEFTETDLDHIESTPTKSFFNIDNQTQANFKASTTYSNQLKDAHREKYINLIAMIHSTRFLNVLGKGKLSRRIKFRRWIYNHNLWFLTYKLF